ncbi:MAG: Chromate resistance protein ChrB [Chloroflexota bacterium]
MTPWLLLVHRIPREPTAGRVSVWRKLKRLGALPLQDAVWVLPVTPRTEEHFRWLAVEIAELGGEATVWHSQLSLGDDKALVQQFVGQVDAAYSEIVRALREGGTDRATLARRYQETLAIDYFQSALGKQARELLSVSEGEKSS